MSRITEYTLIRKAQKGDTAALEELIGRYYDQVFAFLYRRTGDRLLAQDLTQETFLRLVKALPGYRPIGKFSNFLFTIAVNLASSHYRKNTLPVREEFDWEQADAGVQIEELLAGREKNGQLRRALLQLPDMQRDAILLRYFHEMKIKDIARVTGAGPPTVKSRIAQGLGKLRLLLEEGFD